MEVKSDFSCEICHAMSFVGDEYAQIEHETIQNICILCAASAEKLGWRIIIWQKQPQLCVLETRGNVVAYVLIIEKVGYIGNIVRSVKKNASK